MSRFNDWTPNTVQVVTPPVQLATLPQSWPDCPDCRQPATSMYNHKHSCTRCQWVAGNSNDHHRIIPKARS